MPCNTVFNYTLFISSPVRHAYSNTLQVQQVHGNGRERRRKTRKSAINYSLRVHQQTITWETLAATTPKPLHWGWKEENGKLTPKQADENIARCNCKSLKNMCFTNQCTCKRYGLKCVPACGKCRGEDCENNEKVTYMIGY